MDLQQMPTNRGCSSQTWSGSRITARNQFRIQRFFWYWHYAFNKPGI